MSAVMEKVRTHPLAVTLQQRWAQFAPREQRLLSALAVVLAIAVLYFVIWQPSYQARLNAEQRLQGQQQQLQWVKQNLGRYQARVQSSEASAPQASGSLTQRLNQAADANDIRLARIQPQGEGVVISVDEANFDRVLAFVAQLEQQYQLQISTLDVARLDTPGQVRVRQLLVTESS
ncbi:general secretion pathway protein M [Idiomarina aquatica]|uniref:Type II secretion system protein M n=1 Tax=Idiomarina aquatica TaxID=1327752 RepID=A0A4R6PNM0_9GAMM|nr:type II secretion system protein M [Idiomarina aquatica]TDP40172.1 general secretion pathway protein M [Idiomarina aquatica]